MLPSDRDDLFDRPGFTCREWFPDITLDGRAALEAHCLPQRWSGVMDTSLVPEAKPLILCNDVVVDPANGNAHLVAVFNAIRPSSRPAYPHQHPEFCVFLQLTDFEGEI